MRSHKPTKPCYFLALVDHISRKEEGGGETIVARPYTMASWGLRAMDAEVIAHMEYL